MWNLANSRDQKNIGDIQLYNAIPLHCPYGANGVGLAPGGPRWPPSVNIPVRFTLQPKRTNVFRSVGPKFRRKANIRQLRIPSENRQQQSGKSFAKFMASSVGEESSQSLSWLLYLSPTPQLEESISLSCIQRRKGSRFSVHCPHHHVNVLAATRSCFSSGMMKTLRADGMIWQEREHSSQQEWTWLLRSGGGIVWEERIRSSRDGRVPILREEPVVIRNAKRRRNSREGG